MPDPREYRSPCARYTTSRSKDTLETKARTALNKARKARERLKVIEEAYRLREHLTEHDAR